MSGFERGVACRRDCRHLVLGEHLLREGARALVPFERWETALSRHDVRRVLEVTDEGGRRHVAPRHAPPERVQLLDERHERMDAANAHGPVVVEAGELPKCLELLVNERGHVAAHEGRHPGVADLEEYEWPQHAETGKVSVWVERPELRAPVGCILEGWIRRDFDPGYLDEVPQRLGVGLPLLDRLLPLALPVPDRPQRLRAARLDLRRSAR